MKLENQVVDSIILGHVEFDDLYIREGDLLSNRITFNVFGIEPRTVNDIIRGYNMKGAIEKNREMLNPEYS